MSGSYKVEVIADNSGVWCGNGCRYPSEAAASLAGADLAMRWLLVREWRVVSSPDAPNYDIVDGRLVRLEVPA